MSGKTAKPGSTSGLTEREARFVAEYLIDLNGAQAAIRAGYSARTAKEQASRLLTRVNVAKAVEEGQRIVATKLEITAERVLAELAKIGFSDVRKIFTMGGNLSNPVDMSDDMAGCVQSVEVITRRTPGDEKNVEEIHKIKLHDKLGALTQIGRHLGMFKDSLSLTGAVTVNIGEGGDADL